MIIRRCGPSADNIHLPGRCAGRRGVIIALLAVLVVALLAFLALAIDIGMLTIAKTQSQNAADVAALTSARTLNGNTSNSYNNAAATTNAQAVLSYNNIMGQAIQSSQLTLTYGSYDYNQTTQAFQANYPPTSGMPWTAVTATVTSTNMQSFFSRVLGHQFLPNVTSTAQAVHRPRDIALVMDLSTSMRFGTLLGFDFYTSTRTTNNPDTVIPTFGHYSSGAAVLTGPTTDRTSSVDNYTVSPSNSTASNSSYSLTYINSFYQNALGASTLIRAFDSYSSTDGGATWTAPTSQTPQMPASSYTSTPGGDVPLYSFGSTTTYAKSVSEVLYGSGSSTTTTNIMWELDGYSAYAAGKPDASGTGSSGGKVPQVWLQADYRAPTTPPSNGSLPFNGYTTGPGYYGKTFFMWPPDPRTTTNGSGQYSPGNATLATFLSGLGIQAGTDMNSLGSMWSIWQAQGATGLTNLQNWLNGTATGGAPFLPQVAGGNYLSTKVPNMTSWNGTALAAADQPSTYYAVCRLFNRGYPGGAAWTSTAFSADWRMRFFGTTDNSVVFNSVGSLNAPGTTTGTGMWPGNANPALATYNALLTWLTTTANPFPTQMRAGRIRYYSQIPSSISGTWPSYGSNDQRFWVELMDHILGFRQTAAGAYLDCSGISGSRPMIGYGADFTWGTVATSALSSLSSTPPYMNYTDNPARPLLRHWFSPILLVDYLHNCNLYENRVGNFFFMQPADCYEAPLYNAKQAYVSAVATMKNNHPNDYFTVVPYSWPRTSATSVGRLNCVSCPLGTNYDYATSALLFPFSTINADGSNNGTEVSPYTADASTGAIPSANFADNGRSDGDTCFAMGLMLAYNQFAVTPTTDSTLRSYTATTPITFPSGMAGGMGRNGAQKVVIFETDGLANCTATANLISTGSYSYYQVRYDMNNQTSSEYPTVNTYTINNSTVLTQIYSLVDQLKSTYGTTRNPFKLYAIGFGPVFAGADSAAALSTLQTMQYHAGTQSDPNTALSSNQIITGTGATMSANLISAFTSILQNGVQIALIK